jgi:hypothetical protein
VSDTQARLAHERDYIARTIATVRIHKDADNCWPQWANIFADQIESLEAELERVTAALRFYADPETWNHGGIAWVNDPERAARGGFTKSSLFEDRGGVARAALAGGARAAHTDLGGDPVEVHPAQSLAERQSELNDPSGSPTSPPKRDPGGARAAQEGDV